MSNLAIVTDSTASIPEAMLEELNIPGIGRPYRSGHGGIVFLPCRRVS